MATASVNMSDFNIYRPRIGNLLPRLSPQLAAGGQGVGNGTSVTPGQLAPVLQAAIGQWAAAGLPASDVARLRQDSIQIVDLPPGYLAVTAIGGSVIEVSPDAAGWGWSVNTLPRITPGLLQRSAQRNAESSSAATPSTHEDLLTVVMHELGHTLGLGDLDPARYHGDLMDTTLAVGVQRLPSSRDVAAVIAPGTTTPVVSTAGDLAVAFSGRELQQMSAMQSTPSGPSPLPARTATRPQVTIRQIQDNQLTSTSLVVTYHPETTNVGSRRTQEAAFPS